MCVPERGPLAILFKQWNYDNQIACKCKNAPKLQQNPRRFHSSRSFFSERGTIIQKFRPKLKSRQKQLKRAKVQTDTSKEDEISSTRTSQTAWFSPDDYEFVDKINQRITDVTGLSADMQASHSELMQIANYGRRPERVSGLSLAGETSLET